MAHSKNNEKQFIQLSIRSPKELKSIEVSEGSLIQEVREEIAKAFGTKADCICMLYSGRILKDGESLTQHRIKDVFTLNIMIKTSLTAVHSSPHASPDLEARKSESKGLDGLGDLGQTGAMGMLGGLGGGLSGLSSLAAGLGGTAGLSAMSGLSGSGAANYAQIHRQLMENPEMMTKLADSPIFQQIMSSPEIMKEVMMSSPESRKLMESNPEMAQVFDNPEAFKVCMDMVRNPAILKACLTGQQDAGGLPAIQSLFGGIAAKTGSQSASGTSCTAAAVKQPQVAIESEPVTAGRRSGALSAAGQSSTFPAAGDSDALPAASDSGAAVPAEDSLRRQRRNSGGGLFDIVNSPAMQTILQQMNSDPEMLSNVLQTPTMQSLMEHLQASSAVAQSETTGSVSVSNEERYKNQVEQLVSMGFTDRTQNLQSLIDVNGNVDAAIDRILQINSQ